MKIRIVSYGPSSGARDLAKVLTEKLGYKVWRGKPMKGFTNISWGYKAKNLPPSAMPKYWINYPELVQYATDKRLAFGKWTDEEVSCVPWTTKKEEAQARLNKGAKVLARTACQQAGSGIKVVEPGGNLPSAELYTRYVPKESEFRVHVFGGKAILVSQKRRKKGVKCDYTIRANHKGWVFCYKNIDEPAGLRELGVAAVRALGLDFGAVDIIFNKKQNKLYALEVNSAPGLCSATLEAYSNAIASQQAQRALC